MKFEVKNRFSGSVQFAAEIECSEDTPFNVKLGLAVKWAYKERANLKGANLEGAYLKGAYLKGAYLKGANLEGAYLKGIKKDFFERLALAKAEVSGLYDYLVRGKINGSVYTGECACFCGTIANIRKENYEEMTNGLRPDGSSPTERWFLGISKGDTPQNNQISKITCDWVREFMTENSIPVPEYRLVSSVDHPELFKVAA